MNEGQYLIVNILKQHSYSVILDTTTITVTHKNNACEPMQYWPSQVTSGEYCCLCVCVVRHCGCVWTAPLCWLNIDLCGLTHGSDPLFLLLMTVCAEVVCPGPNVFCLHAKHNMTCQLSILAPLLLQPHLQREEKNTKMQHITKRVCDVQQLCLH